MDCASSAASVAKAGHDGVDRLVPADALEARPPLRSDASEGMQHTVRRVGAFEIARDRVHSTPWVVGMVRRIAAHLDGARPRTLPSDMVSPSTVTSMAQVSGQSWGRRRAPRAGGLNRSWGQAPRPGRGASVARPGPGFGRVCKRRILAAGSARRRAENGDNARRQAHRPR